MTQEDKSLLLKYLCMALPYVVKIELMPVTKGKCVVLTPIILQDYFISDKVNYLPYLRPMSNMTNEEKEELNCLCYHNISVQDNMLQGYLCGCEIIDVIDWLLRNHFDFMGLIPKGMALEAPSGMYN